MPQLLDVTHALDKGNSMRITVPRIIRENPKIKDGDILGFFEKNGNVIIKKME